MALDPVQIGRYKILGTLGQGAMGTVYLAEDPALRRGIAIKVVRGGFGDQAVMARFRREAEISARLNHPNIITIFDVGEEPALGPFLAMEYVDGEGLDALLKAGPLPPAEGMQLLLQAGQALEAIHQAGVVHRDVKPSNFMVAKDGRLKLMDFGIARGDEPRLTTTAAFLGSPSYSAPESLVGSEKPIDAADRWALSVTAFEVLTGRLPFEAESVNAVLYRVAHEPPKFPEQMDAALRAVFERALAKAPENRFPSIREFMRALAEVLPLDEAQRSVVFAQIAAPNSTTGPYRSSIRSGPKPSKKIWIISVVAAVAALVGLGLGFIHRNARVMAIYSSPSGARVLLDGIDLGKTPLPEVVIRGHAGKLRLEKTDYLPIEHPLGPDEERLDFRLIPTPFTMSVTTVPSGAAVFLDGVQMGISPQQIQVPGDGRHQLEVHADGFDAWSTFPSRGEALPEPIRLHKHTVPKSPPKDSKVKRFWKDLLKP